MIPLCSKKRLLPLAFLLAPVLPASVWLLKDPVAFRQLISVRPTPQDSLPRLALTPGFDPKRTLAAIPFRTTTRVDEALPEKQYRRSILEGDGNCSNLSFGLAYKFEEMHHDYRVVFLMRLPLSRRAGEGHTVLQTAMDLEGGKTENGILDLIEKGIPQKDGKPLKLIEIRREGFAGVRVHRLAERASGDTFYAQATDSIAVGVLTSADVREYFRFIEAVYFPLGSPLLEKALFEGLALLAGYYPDIHVTPDQFRVIEAEDGWRRSLCLALIWSYRLVAAAAALTLIWAMLPRPRGPAPGELPPGHGRPLRSGLARIRNVMRDRLGRVAEPRT